MLCKTNCWNCIRSSANFSSITWKTLLKIFEKQHRQKIQIPDFWFSQSFCKPAISLGPQKIKGKNFISGENIAFQNCSSVQEHFHYNGIKNWSEIARFLQLRNVTWANGRPDTSSCFLGFYYSNRVNIAPLSGPYSWVMYSPWPPGWNTDGSITFWVPHDLSNIHFHILSILEIPRHSCSFFQWLSSGHNGFHYY